LFGFFIAYSDQHYFYQQVVLARLRLNV